MQTETRIAVLKPTMTIEEMAHLLDQRGYDVYEREAPGSLILKHVIEYAVELGYDQTADGSGFRKPPLTTNDIKALAWIQEHFGEVKFCKGYIRFNEDGSIDGNMSCPNQHYVIVRLGLMAEVTAKTIEQATLQLQAIYFGSKWSEQLKADLYA